MSKLIENTINDFSIERLMGKVANGGHSLYSEFTQGDYEYTVFVSYDRLFGSLGINNPDEEYNIDIIREDENRKQDRVLYESGLKYDDVISVANKWLDSIK